MPRSALILSSLLLLAACGQKAEAPARDAAPAPEPVSAAAPVSDELPGLSAPATGIAFWDHPTLAFNGMMLVASAAGVTAYNMEDGAEVGAADGFNAQGLDVSYFGFGPAAAGLAVFFDADASAFRFYGVDNTSRALIPLDGAIDLRGAVRGFCLGRAIDTAFPTLFVINKGEVRLFNLQPATGGVEMTGEFAFEAPDDARSCTVASDGVLLLAADNGAVYRVTDDNPFKTPFAKAAIEAAGDLSEVRWTDETSGAQSKLILFADRQTGAVSAFDSASGALKGTVSFTATDESAGVAAAPAFAAASLNLGALYRTGAIAFAAEAADGPSIRLAPLDALLNALEITGGVPASPRGALPEDKKAPALDMVFERPE